MLSKASAYLHKINRMKYFFIITALVCFFNAHAESKRIEVYKNGLTFWDVQSGDTLNEIINQLLPYKSFERNRLITEIINLNPAAFYDNDPDKLQAGVRIWLPGSGLAPRTKAHMDKYKIQHFSWGYIKSRK